jgi:NAD(P) transhydrogenase subunit alpha
MRVERNAPKVAREGVAAGCRSPHPGILGEVMSFDLELGLFIFMLATFIGLEVIRKVSPLLHTPLMSLTNAISAISVVGAILITGAADATMLSKVLGFIAITAVVTNIVSGFLITDRMVKMFKKREAKK